VGCSNTTRPQLTTDLTAGLQVATALEAAYAASPHADPKIVAQLTRLLASAQAAMAAFNGSTSATDQAVASAAIAALVEYEASAHVAL
jgi:hypothetical protein